MINPRRNQWNNIFLSPRGPVLLGGNRDGQLNWILGGVILSRGQSKCVRNINIYLVVTTTLPVQVMGANTCWSVGNVGLGLLVRGALSLLTAAVLNFTSKELSLWSAPLKRKTLCREYQVLDSPKQIVMTVITIFTVHGSGVTRSLPSGLSARHPRWRHHQVHQGQSQQSEGGGEGETRLMMNDVYEWAVLRY